MKWRGTVGHQVISCSGNGIDNSNVQCMLAMDIPLLIHWLKNMVMQPPSALDENASNFGVGSVEYSFSYFGD